jgi:hypothetical protein
MDRNQHRAPIQPAEPGGTRRAARHPRHQLRRVEVVLHQARIVQIVKTEKLRLEPHPPRPELATRCTHGRPDRWRPPLSSLEGVPAMMRRLLADSPAARQRAGAQPPAPQPLTLEALAARVAELERALAAREAPPDAR